MFKILYLDGSCGISGDMTVASLLDLGGNLDKLNEAIESLHLDGVHIHATRGTSYSIAGLNFEVHVHEHSADDIESHEEGYVEHHHEHSHENIDGHSHHHHEHRHLSEVFEIIDRGNLNEHAKKIAHRIFEIIAIAEAKAHGVSKDEVHFHEVGAIDSIVDIVAAAVLIDDLGITDCVVTGLCEGSGFVTTQHGNLPIPVPAVSNIAEAASIALHITETKGEMVTPTGIAIVAAIRTRETLPEGYKILKSGIGLGKRDFHHANFLRAQIIEELPHAGNDPKDCHVYILESNIDDSTPEELGYAMDKLFEAGARDVHFMPCFMKKSRPGVILRAIVDDANLHAVERALFKHTSTIGYRRIPVERNCMSREMQELETPFGKVRLKKSTFEDIKKVKLEFDDLKEIAEKTGLSISEIKSKILAEKS